MHRQALLASLALATCTAHSSSLPSSSSSSSGQCRAVPGSSDWPSVSEWSSLNSTLSGRLLKSLPPEAVCHSNEPIYNTSVCNTTDWTAELTYTETPLGMLAPNWNNDACLPGPQYPCTTDWFPAYVVNATCAADVVAGINFAREHNIRLNVKATGHDYLGRSTAANSLQIWTYNMRGIEFDDSFVPQSCDSCSPTPAVRLGAGENWGDIYPAAGARNITIVGGVGDTIGIGGYMTGGGHGPLSAKYGLALEQVLEMEVVLASGKIVTANQAVNSDLFWALRGGGGATFGVLTSVVIKTFQEMPIAFLGINLETEPNSDAYWESVPYMLSQTAMLQNESGVVSYFSISPSYDFNGTTAGGCFDSIMLIPNGTVEELQNATSNMRTHLEGIPGVKTSFRFNEYPSVHDYVATHNSQEEIGFNVRIGNRLLNGSQVSNATALVATMRKATPPGILSKFNVIAGPGLWAAVPAGGSASVLPAWKGSYAEYVVTVTWPFLNDTAGQAEANLLTNTYMEALREYAPDSGAYVNEADVDEPNFHQAFWGDNYPRLLDIKKQVDPEDIFWCVVCVGNENWVQRGTQLCRT